MFSDPYLAEYSPSELAEMVGVSTDNLRDWRRRGLIKDIGTNDGARGWKYSVVDIAAIWWCQISKVLSEFERARLVAALIALAISAKKNELPLRSYEYALDEIDFGDMCVFHALFSDKDPDAYLLESLADAPKDYSQASVINLGETYRQMPPSLREALFAADIDGKRSGKAGAKSLAANRPSVEK